ncbi:MAG: hypothetical protein K9L30_12545 [Desulfobacterales bacterium]|nr:hypothetical protein [Desulfobacterales bacterium]
MARSLGNDLSRMLVFNEMSLTEESLAWAIKRDNVQLQAEIDSVLAEWKSNGFLQTILNNRIPVKISFQ